MPCVRELRPCPDPGDVARRLSRLPHLALLDSSDRHPTRGRYSYAMADPVEWRTDWPTKRKSGVSIAGLPPFQGGWVGMIGYGECRRFEAIPPHRKNDLPTVTTAWGRYDTVVAWDHAADRCWLIGGRATVAAALAADAPAFAHRKSTAARLAESYPLPGHDGVRSNFSRAHYLNAVRNAIDYVHAGDVFQVNLSQRMTAPLHEHPLAVYGRLRSACPAPFGAYFDLGDAQILSASPEQFLRLMPDGTVITRPIKGTRPRGATPDDDDRLRHDLTTNPKDRAENVMIVDLLRNDLGKVCEFGSVTVPIVCEVESHNYVHHLVSEVRGRLKPDCDALDLLAACVPGGSVTGAPKVRAMEIIAELEPTERGPYCGSLVWIGDDGAMDSSILIRTMTASHGWLQFPVGGGIVADSTPEREYDETLHKAARMLAVAARPA
jgi:para-aminobenzoate synthetase component 1